MSPYRIRQAAFIIIIISSTLIISGIWFNWFTFYKPKIFSESHIDTFLATAVQTTSTMGGLIVALIFITAQLSSSRPSVLRELYRSVEVYILLAYLITTLILGYLTLTILSPFDKGTLDLRIINIILIMASTSVILIVPVLILQIENLTPTTLVSKLADRIKPRAVIDYGLTTVQCLPGDPTRIVYQLNTVGLRPRNVDPFRPIHEVLMEAVNVQDRVLFGKLFTCIGMS